MGVQGGRQRARTPQGASGIQGSPSRGKELQIMSGQNEHKTMTLKLIVWRQKGPNEPGRFETYTARNITEHHSFLEMLDVVNEDLIKEGKEPIIFDHDCREGICGVCSQVINGVPHCGQERTTPGQLPMRKFKDGDTIYIEPWRARAFPILKDLMVDRGALDTIIQAGGDTPAPPGGAPAATPIP